jgi:signal recognition particle subunit SEC65
MTAASPHPFVQQPHEREGRRVVGNLAVSTVDLARLQFATTSLYHFRFVPQDAVESPLEATA